MDERQERLANLAEPLLEAFLSATLTTIRNDDVFFAEIERRWFAAIAGAMQNDELSVDDQPNTDRAGQLLLRTICQMFVETVDDSGNLRPQEH